MKEDLNTVRINGLKQRRFREIDDRITVLERAMDNINHGQGESRQCVLARSASANTPCAGVGFAVFNTVLDKKMLKTILSLIATSAVTVATSVLAYSAYTVENSGAAAQCTLSAAQVGAVQGLVKLMTEENATCACESEMHDISLVSGCPTDGLGADRQHDLGLNPGDVKCKDICEA